LKKTVSVEYFATLRDERGEAGDTFETEAETFQHLFDELKEKYSFSLSTDEVKIIANNSMSKWDAALSDGDTLIFMPPIAGG